jgi:hypothetical protein
MRGSRPILALALMTQGVMVGEAVTFSAKPKVVRAGEVTQISFAVSAPTDAAVFIEDARGTIIRHLVAGVLGSNAPAPFLAGSLEQTVIWDGKADYDRPATGGPFKVRVSLGLSAKYESIVSRRPPKFAGSMLLATGPDGAVYVRHSDFPSGNMRFSHWQLVVLNRDGSYRRMLLPYAATPDNREAKGHHVADLNGAWVPAVVDEKDLLGDLGGCNTVTRDGKHLYGLTSSGLMSLCTAGGANGALVVPLEKGGRLGASPGFANPASAVLSSDDKQLFFTGVADTKGRAGQSAVFRAKVPDRTGQDVFFGDPRTPGNDRDHLGRNPGGVASDGRGSLVVADSGNNRIVILDESNGTYRGEFKAAAPLFVGVVAKAGAVYVGSVAKGGLRLAKYALATPPAGDSLVSWGDAKQAGEVVVPMRTELTQSMAVDGSTDPVVIWMSGGYMGSLSRIEDRNGKFEVTAGPASPDINDGNLCVVVDRQTKEVYVRNGAYNGLWERYCDETGKSEMLTIPGGWPPNLAQIVPAPNGNLYGARWPWFFYQCDRKGKPVPFREPHLPTDEEKRLNFPSSVNKIDGELKAAQAQYAPIGMGGTPHTLGVRWGDGHLFLMEAYLFSADRVKPEEGCGGRIMKAMHEYLPDGHRVTTTDSPIVWKVTDAAVGPKFDAAGNIYIADIVRPKGWAFPPELKAYLADKGGNVQAGSVLTGEAAAMAANYGSIVKFSPRGGMIHYAKSGWGAATGHDPFVNEPKFAPGLREMEVDFFYRCLKPVKITGAEWVHPGIGHIGLWGCNCENMTFDVDEFGRVFFPDFAMFQIRVIDTAGNSIVNVGGYGNADNCGPESAIVDPKTGVVRPRRPDDPRELVSPFAKPEIAMAWPTGVGVTDKHLYIGDAVNRRLLRADLSYAAEETCEIK